MKDSANEIEAQLGVEEEFIPGLFDMPEEEGVLEKGGRRKRGGKRKKALKHSSQRCVNDSGAQEVLGLPSLGAVNQHALKEAGLVPSTFAQLPGGSGHFSDVIAAGEFHGSGSLVHELPEAPPCKFFVIGKCLRGMRCAYAHSRADIELPTAFERFRENLSQKEIRDIQAIEAIQRKWGRASEPAGFVPPI